MNANHLAEYRRRARDATAATVESPVLDESGFAIQDLMPKVAEQWGYTLQDGAVVAELESGISHRVRRSSLFIMCLKRRRDDESSSRH
jgi:hypothetical protein